MDLEDLFEPEVAVAVAVTAAVSSPKVRKALRTGLVYAIGGVLAASDRLQAAGRSVAESARRTGRAAAAAAGDAAESEADSVKAGAAVATGTSEGANPA